MFFHKIIIIIIIIIRGSIVKKAHKNCRVIFVCLFFIDSSWTIYCTHHLLLRCGGSKAEGKLAVKRQGAARIIRFLCKDLLWDMKYRTACQMAVLW